MCYIESYDQEYITQFIVFFRVYEHYTENDNDVTK